MCRAPPEELPKTGTGKIDRLALRRRGLRPGEAPE
jgi:acyl-coenzyme A synthetase/AMP-(fatty) acid ligase